jgi:hypothetical protein
LRVFAFLLFSISTYFVQAQFLEFGAGLGGFNYSGDLVRGYKINNIRPGFNILHRQNYSNIISIRYGLAAGYVAGSDDQPIDAFAVERDRSFNVTVIEASVLFEYHFLDYKHKDSPVRWSPFAFLGVGFAKWNNTDATQDFSKIQPSIPMGLGVKKLVGKRFSVDFEFGIRKTFFDYIDGISDTDDLAIKDYQYGNPNLDDWYMYTGISLNFIIYKIPCPFPYTPNKYMLKR